MSTKSKVLNIPYTTVRYTGNGLCIYVCKILNIFLNFYGSCGVLFVLFPCLIFLFVIRFSFNYRAIPKILFINIPLTPIGITRYPVYKIYSMGFYKNLPPTPDLLCYPFRFIPFTSIPLQLACYLSFCKYVRTISDLY